MSISHSTQSKPCSKCRVIKPLADFGAEERRPDGRRCQCKQCARETNAAYRKNSLALQRRRARYKADSYGRKYALKYKYGITEDGYNFLLGSQCGCCAICKAKTAGGRYGDKFRVDHDHDTGAIRGLLCNRCNRVLGLLGDNIEGVERVVSSIVEYLKTTPEIKEDFLCDIESNRSRALGEDHGGSKLKRADILDVFRLKSQGMTSTAIARRISVDISTISSILHRKTWAHVDIPPEYLPPR